MVQGKRSKARIDDSNIRVVLVNVDIISGVVWIKLEG